MKQGFEVRFLNCAGVARQVRALRRLIKLEQPDVIQTALYEADIAGRLAALGSHTPVVGSLVTLAYTPVRFKDPYLNVTKYRMVKAIDSWTARHLTTHFHAVSQAAKAAAVTNMRIPPERITVVERGRDCNDLGQPGLEKKSRARNLLGLSPDEEVLVNVGRHVWAKGQSYLLEAVQQLITKRHRLVLLVAGPSGSITSELERLRNKAGLNGHVRFLGHRDDVPDILAAADLFVFPSLYEGLPGAVIEAMALGLPIVASDIAAVREVVEKDRNALLVKPASATELAAAIETLLAERRRAAAFGQRSRELFEARFTLELSAVRMVDFYHRMATMRAGSLLKAKKSIG
jgi:glycosyltransferase involved in cell wall biosynthesis